MRAVDVSVYSGEISTDQWQKIKNDGYELAVVGLFHGRTVNRFAGQQLSGAIQVGLEVAAYVFIAPWTGWTGPQQVAAGMAEAQAYKDKLRFVAVDVEADGVTGKMVRDALDTVKALGQRPILYTGRWWWVGHFGDSQLFKDYSLWAAYYPLFLHKSPDDLVEDVPLYGGWTRESLVGWQHTNTVQFHGVTVCKDWFNSEWVMEGKEEGKEEQVNAPLFQIKGRPEVYYLYGSRWNHIKDAESFKAAGYKEEDKTMLDKDSVLLDLSVEYPGGVPGPLR